MGRTEHHSAGARALALVLFFILVWTVGCSTSTGPDNGVAPCTNSSECPGNYYCAADQTCWQNGSAPSIDASTCPGATCGGACVDTATDSANCGGCGVACKSGEVCSKGTCALTCGGGTSLCGDACHDTKSDPSNCGACGKVCQSGLVCSNGACALACTGGATKCGSACVDTGVDSANCGACGAVCGAGRLCSAGKCTSTCGAGLTTCGGADGGDGGALYCANTLTDNANCGVCGKSCANGLACTGGVCATTCASNETLCGGSAAADGGASDGGPTYCADLGVDRTNCGTCGKTCDAGLVCSSGACQLSCQANLVNCGGTCVDPNASLEHCGATLGCGAAGSGTGSAGTACASGNVCANGVCQVSCPGSQVICNGTCIDPLSSPTHCGATAGCGAAGTGSAGATCSNGNVCANGVCKVSCPGNQINCGGVCIDPLTSRTFCGASGACGNGGGSAGTTCTSGNVCGNGVCQLSCPGNEINCGGTCVDPLTSRSNCGATGACGIGGGSSGSACTNGNVCSAGSCQVSCPGSQVNCGGTCVDPLTSPTNCGATGLCGNGGGSAGAACTNGNVCSGGACQVSCPGNQINCGGVCIDPQTSLSNCGASGLCGNGGGTSGTACPAGNVCGNGTCAVACPGSQINCGGTCVDPLTSRSYCGATAQCGNGGGTVGTACSNGTVCSSGTCQVSCPGSQINCGGVCIDPLTSRSYCGASGLCGLGGGSAGSTCTNGNVCGNGLCQVSCPGNEINCGGTCVDPLTSRSNCGATGLCGNGGGTTGAACTSGKVCSAGSCQVSCPGSQVNCGGICVDPLTSPTNCGATGLCGNGGGSAGAACTNGNVCSAGACKVSCPGTQINCGGVCIDPQTSLSNCGASGLCGNGGGTPGTSCAAGNVCGNGACAVACPGSQIDCGGTCVDPQTSRSFCGASGACSASGGTAGTACTNGNVCNSGSCQVSCPGTQINCGGVCIDPKTSPSNCGASGACSASGGTAGTACTNGNVCNNGSCQVSCPGSEINCGGVCIDPKTSPSYCGASGACSAAGGTAGAACTNGNVCSNGTCKVSCPGTQINCGGVCIDPLTSPTNCGASGACSAAAGTGGAACTNGNVCNNGSCQVSCPGSEINCGGTCIDPKTSPSYCGASGACNLAGGTAGTACTNGNVCSNGSCQVSCPGTQINCGGICIDPKTSPSNCGASGACSAAAGTAGAACTNGNVCSSGSCQVSCPGTEINCGGVCIDPKSSPFYCGASGTCSVASGTAGTTCTNGNVCSNGSCQVSCPGTQINCGGVCIDPKTSPSNCGASGACSAAGGTAGAACTNGNVCNSGTCQVSCPGTQINCGGTCIDPKTSPSNCGASGTCSAAGGTAGATCTNGNVCSGGTCQVSCPGTQINCGGICIDPKTSSTNCGASATCSAASGTAGTACTNGNVCSNGSCKVSCPGTQINCGGTCIDPQTSPTNCGASGTCTGGTTGTACGAGTVCTSGVCSASCQSPLAACSGACVDERNDPAHCGSCNPCPAVANVNANYCAGSTCGIASCVTNFADCNGTVADGCEANKLTDPNNCGGCGKSCPAANPYCASGTCAPAPVCNTAPENGVVTLSCPTGQVIKTVAFASYGTPSGSCGNFTLGGCNATNSTAIVSSLCVGQASCSVGANNGTFGDPCGGTVKNLNVQVQCAVTNTVTAGLIANYDARIASSMTINGSNQVTQWNDQSGNGNHLTNNGAPPIYQATLINNLPGLDFGGGAGMFTSAAGFSLAQNVTVFFVVQWRSPGGWGSLGHHGNRDSDWAMEQNGSTGNANLVHWQTNNDNGSSQLLVSGNTNWILTGRMDTTNGRYFSAYSTAGGLISTTATLDTIVPGIKRMYIGKSDANEASNAYFGQILYYNRSLSDTERDQVNAYLRSSWGF